MQNVIVIDNGSYECRAGFSDRNDPDLIFRNVVMKSRSRQKSVFVGHVDNEFDINQMNTKSPFEHNLSTQTDLQETIFDHVFHQIGIKASSITNPVVISEALCCPYQCRAQMSQLLLETYSIDKIAFFVDGLSSYYYNFGMDVSQKIKDAIVMSFGYQTTHIMPLSGKMGANLDQLGLIPSASRRLNIGGAHISWHLQHILNLKYPCHAEKLAIPIAEEIIHNFGRVSSNYREEMNNWKDDTYRSLNTIKWELPFCDESKQKANAHEERLLIQAERRQIQAERFRDRMKKRNIEKFKDEEEEYSGNCTVKLKKNKVLKYDCNISNDMDGETTKIQTARQKKSAEFLASFALPAAVQAQMTSAPVAPSAGLTEQKLRRRELAAKDLELRRKNDLLTWLTQIDHKRQRVAKQRTLRQSRIDLATELGVNAQDPEMPPTNFEDILTSLDRKHSRASIPDDANAPLRAAPLNERRQRQLEKIRAMTAELKPERTVSISKKNLNEKSKIGAVRGSVKRVSQLAKKKLDIGDDDILDTMEQPDSLDAFPFENSRGGGFGDDEFDMEPGEDLKEVVPKPLVPTSTTSIFPYYTNSPSRVKDLFERLEEASDVSEGERDQLAVLDSVRAAYDPAFIKETGTAGLKVDLSEYYQIHFGSEPIRSTEAFFERSLIGSGQAGLGECLSWVLRDSSQSLYHDNPTNQWIPKRLFITGGPANLPGMKERLHHELQQLLPWREGGNSVEVVVAAYPTLDAWKGARQWSIYSSQNAFTGFTTKKQYEECGLDYLSENKISNRYYGNPRELEINPKFTPGRGRQPNIASKLET